MRLILPHCYMNGYFANARPIRRKYSDRTRRARSNELTATGHESKRLYVSSKD